MDSLCQRLFKAGFCRLKSVRVVLIVPGHGQLGRCRVHAGNGQNGHDHEQHQAYYESGTALISLHIDIFHFNSLQMSLYEREFRSKMVFETCMRRN